MKASLNNFNYAVFLNFLLLILVSSVTFHQDKAISNLQRLEQLLIMKKLFTLDSVFKFQGIEGTTPKQQVRRLYRFELAKGKKVVFSTSQAPVNEKFVQTKINPVGVMQLKAECDCDSNLSTSISKQFLVYKIKIINDEINKSDILFPGFTVYFTNAELIRSKKEHDYCLVPRNSSMYLEETKSDELYPRYTKSQIESELQVILNQNKSLDSNFIDFYTSIISKKDYAIIKVPLIDINLDAKKSRGLLQFVSICLTAFMINMFRKIVENRKKLKDELFILYEVTKDAFSFIKDDYSVNNLKIDSILVLIYFGFSFCSPLLILAVSYFQDTSSEIDQVNFATLILLTSISLYFVLLTFSLYLKMIKVYIDPRIFQRAKNVIIDIFREEEDQILR